MFTSSVPVVPQVSIRPHSPVAEADEGSWPNTVLPGSGMDADAGVWPCNVLLRHGEARVIAGRARALRHPLYSDGLQGVYEPLCPPPPSHPPPQNIDISK